MAPISPAERVARIQRWSQWFMERTESYDGPIGAELAYLYQAIAHDTCIEVDAGSPLVALLRAGGVPSTDPIWRYLDFGQVS